MRIAIVTGRNGIHVRELTEAAVRRGHVVVPVEFQHLVADVDEAGPRLPGNLDAVIVRTMPLGSLEQVVFRMDRLQALAGRGIPIVNPPKALETCIDKYLCDLRLRQAGLRVPRTVVCQSADDAQAVFTDLGSDVVVKPLFGSEGRGMVRVSDPELAWRTFRSIERMQSVIYVQEFIRHPGWDVRAFVLQGRVIAAMKRRSVAEWRTNVAQGAAAERFELTTELEEAALRASAAVGTVAAGVDLLPGPDGTWYVLEVNAVPGWQAVSQVCGVDIATAMIQAVEAPRTESAVDPVLTACVWEATARKAGNVHPEASFADLRYADFLSAAAVTAIELARAPGRPLGATILSAVEASHRATRTNVNLGIVLALAPLAAVPPGTDLRQGVKRVLATTTVADAEVVYQAIRIAQPGGLGQAAEQDVSAVPTVTLTEAMALAADRDGIAAQYAQGFADLFDFGIPTLQDGMRRFGTVESAIQWLQICWLARFPDTLIARKCGWSIAREVSARAAELADPNRFAGPDGRTAYQAFDRYLRSDEHRLNPGTTADLIAACLFAALRERKIDPDARFA